jgi:methylase of polypeptide subunit release factors
MPRLIAPADLRKIGRFLSQSGYDIKTIRDEIGLTEVPWRKLRNRQYLLYLTGPETPAHLLAQLFYSYQPVEEHRLRTHVPADVLDLMLEADLLCVENGIGVAQCMLSPMEGVIVLADQLISMESQPRSDMVLPPNPTTQTLSRFMLRRAVRSALDLGTGSGILALLLAKHADSVLGTDINPRAILFAQISAALNGIENVEFVTGDGLEPAKDRRFDQVVANPPFFVSPTKDFVFCHTSMELDGFCRALAQSVPDHLNDDGFFQMICEWVQLEGQPWTARLAEWFNAPGCDVMIWKAFDYNIAKYAQERLFESNPLDAEKDSEVFHSKIRFFRDKQVAGISGGLVAMHHRVGQNWVRIQDLNQTPHVPFGDDVLRRFSGYTVVKSVADEELVLFKPKLVPAARLRQESEAVEGVWKPVYQRLEIIEGLLGSLAVDPLVSSVIARFDGTRTVSDIAAEVAKSTGAELGVVESEVLRLIRRLAEDGFIEFS